MGQDEAGKVGRGRIVPGSSQGEKSEFYSECKWEATGGFKSDMIQFAFLRDLPSCCSEDELEGERAVGRLC